MLFERFRKPRWQHPDARVRRQAVIQLSPLVPEELKRLERIAAEDPGPAVRAAAVKRLQKPAMLREIWETDEDATVRETARARYRQLLSGAQEDVDLTERLAELRRCNDPQLLANLARSAREETLRLTAVERVPDPGVLEEVAVNDTVARVRQAAVERIDQPEALERIARAARNRDRRVMRFARERLEALRDRAERYRAVAVEAERVVGELERLLGSQRLPSTAGAQRQRLGNRWAALPEEPPQALAERYAELDGRLAERLAAPGTEVSERPAAPAAETVSPAALLEPLLEEIGQGRDPDPAQIDRLAAALDAGAGAEPSSGSRERRLLDAMRRYLNARDELDQGLNAADAGALERVLNRVDWPDEDLPVPERLRRAEEWLASRPPVPEAGEADAAEESATEPEADGREETLERLRGCLGQVESALAEGHLKSSQRHLQGARSLAEGVPGGLPRRLERRLARLRAQVAELRDWRRFAVLPKQEELCAAMEALVEERTLEPPERARRIKELQQQWKETGGSDSPRSRELWTRFSRAAETAFQPCREWFQREAERRQHNLEERRRICEQLQAFMERADLAGSRTVDLDRIRRTARNEWNAHAPVDRQAVLALQERFEALMDELSAVIEDKRSAAREAKAELVRRAESLAEADDPEAAAEDAKALQGEWKKLGPARPSDDRVLWKAFRAACDRIFERRDQVRAAARGREDSLVKEAEALCAALETLAEGRDGADTLQRRSRQVGAEFRGLNLPDSRVGRGVAARFERAQRAVADRIGELETRGRREELEALARAGSACARLEAGDVDGPDPESLLPTDAPDWLVAPLKERIARARTGAGVAEEDEHRRRELCIGVEILAGVESPEEDRPRRMELQVARLSRGMGEGIRRPQHEDARRLAAEWYGVAGADETLEGRFRRALERLL